MLAGQRLLEGDVVELRGRIAEGSHRSVHVVRQAEGLQQQGGRGVVRDDDHEPGKVVDLMEVLKKSLAGKRAA